jgi:hypothetical protein
MKTEGSEQYKGQSNNAGQEKKRDSKQGDPQVDLEGGILTKSLGKESGRVGGIVDMVSNIRQRSHTMHCNLLFSY